MYTAVEEIKTPLRHHFQIYEFLKVVRTFFQIPNWSVKQKTMFADLEYYKEQDNINVTYCIFTHFMISWDYT